MGDITYAGSSTRIGGSLFVSITDFGGICDGVTDNTTAMNNAIAAVFAASPSAGGTIGIPGPCVIAGAIAIPFTGTSPPQQPPLRITGLGTSWDGTLVGNDSGGGSSLNLQYTGGDGLHPAKIDTRGIGILEIDHLVIKDTSGDNFLFLQTTNTTLNIHDVHFIGNATNSGSACVQDALQFGGITSASSTLGGVLSTNGFQGYGTRISNCQFSHIRRAMNFGGSANSIFVENVAVDTTCGSSETTGAPYQFLGIGLGTFANTIYGGFVEITNYPYAVAMTSDGVHNNARNSFFGFSTGDHSGGTVASFYFDANSSENAVYLGNEDAGSTIFAGLGASLNGLFPGESSTPAQLPFGAIVGAGTGSPLLEVYGAGSGNNNGPQISFKAGSTTVGAIGSHSAVSGGAFDQTMTYYSQNEMHFFVANNKLGLGIATPNFTEEISAVGAYGSHAGTGGLAISNPTNETKKLYMGYDPTLGTNGSGYLQAIDTGVAVTPLLFQALGGNVGIGTTTPGATLDVKGAILTEGVTFSALPGTPVAGMISYVTDSTVNTAGSNVTVGGGSDKVLVWYNGTHWTVIGN